jgi:hypothetical protein
MSSVENWTKRVSVGAFHASERSQQPCDRTPGERSPIYVIVRTRGSLNSAGALDNFKANSRTPN